MNDVSLSTSIRAIPVIVRITLRQLLGRRRTILLLLLSALPILLAVIFRAAGQSDVDRFARNVLDAFAVTILLTIVSVVAAGLVALAGTGGNGMDAIVGFVAAMAVGSLCYVSFFLALSLYTRRALMAGIFYFLIWEGVLSSLLSGIANFSIRQYSLGTVRAFFPLDPEEARLSPSTALPLAAILIVVALALATRKLMRFETSGDSD